METLNELIRSMSKAGHSVTNEWDMVCAYSQDFVNKCFSEKFAERELVCDVAIDYTYQDEEHVVEYKYQGTLRLKDPFIEFLTMNDNLCRLIMPITEGEIVKTTTILETGTTKTTTYNFDPYTVQLTCLVPIASVVGDGKIAEGGTLISFTEEDKEEEGKLFLHFENSETSSFKLDAIPGKEEAAAENPFIHETPLTRQLWEAIAIYIKENVSSIDYELASVKYIPDNDLTIKPKSFIFCLNQPDEKSAPALMLYIQAEDSEYGEGNMRPNFQIAGVNKSPLPEGYNAAFMIRSEYMDSLLKKAFSDYNAKVIKHEANRMELELTVKGKIQTDKIDKSNIMVVDVFDGITIDLATKPFNLLVELKEVEHEWKTVKSLKYESEEGRGKYRFSSSIASLNGALIASVHVESKSYPKNEMTEEVPPMEYVDSDFDLSFIIANNPNIDISVNTRNEGQGIAKHLNIEEQKKFIEQQFKSQVSNIKLSMKAIDTFIARNLLLPDKFVFRLGKDCYIPKDYVAFGNLEKI